MGRFTIMLMFFLYTVFWWILFYKDDPFRHQVLIIQHIFLAAGLLSSVRR